MYLYRAVDSIGVTLDFLLMAKQDAAAARHILAKGLGGATHPPRVINTNKHAACPSAIVLLSLYHHWLIRTCRNKAKEAEREL
jgi:transposase-like protein